MTNTKRVPVKPEEIQVGDWVKVRGYCLRVSPTLPCEWAHMENPLLYRVVRVNTSSLFEIESSSDFNYRFDRLNIISAEREVVNEPKPGEWRCRTHEGGEFKPCWRDERLRCERPEFAEVYRAAQGDKPAGWSRDERKGERERRTR